MYDGDYIERLFLFEKPLTSRFRKKCLSEKVNSARKLKFHTED